VTLTLERVRPGRVIGAVLWVKARVPFVLIQFGPGRAAHPSRLFTPESNATRRGPPRARCRNPGARRDGSPGRAPDNRWVRSPPADTSCNGGRGGAARHSFRNARRTFPKPPVVSLVESVFACHVLQCGPNATDFDCLDLGQGDDFPLAENPLHLFERTAYGFKGPDN